MLSINKKQIAFFSALCMLLSLIEMIIPRPVPFFRLGLSNLSLMLAIYVGIDFKNYFILLVFKLLATSITSGTLFSYVFILSLCSTLLSGPGMFFAYKLKSLSFVGVSIIGASLSNMAQCFVAILILGTQSTYLFVPVFVLGFISSTILGLLANSFIKSSSISNLSALIDKSEVKVSDVVNETNLKSKLFIILYFALLLFLFFIKGLNYSIIIFGFSTLLVYVNKKKIRIINSILLVFCVTLLSLFQPEGKVLCYVFSFAITQNALLYGLNKAFILLSTINLSKLILLDTSSFNKIPIFCLQMAYLSKMSEFLGKKKENNAIKIKNLVRIIDEAILYTLN